MVTCLAGLEITGCIAMSSIPGCAALLPVVQLLLQLVAVLQLLLAFSGLQQTPAQMHSKHLQ